MSKINYKRVLRQLKARDRAGEDVGNLIQSTIEAMRAPQGGRRHGGFKNANLRGSTYKVSK